MNRHQRRAASKLNRPALGALAKVDQAMSQLQSISGLAEVPVVLDRVRQAISDMSSEVTRIQEEVRARDEVMLQLVAQLTGRSLAEVVAMQTKLIAEAQKGLDGS